MKLKKQEKKAMIGLLLVCLFLVGCMPNSHVYFEMDTCNKTMCELKEECKDLCLNSGIKIWQNKDKYVLGADGVCDCW